MFREKMRPVAGNSPKNRSCMSTTHLADPTLQHELRALQQVDRTLLVSLTDELQECLFGIGDCKAPLGAGRIQTGDTRPGRGGGPAKCQPFIV